MPPGRGPPDLQSRRAPRASRAALGRFWFSPQGPKVNWFLVQLSDVKVLVEIAAERKVVCVRAFVRPIESACARACVRVRACVCVRACVVGP